jgi:hypothetical protein
MGVKYCSKGHKATYNVSPPTECPTCKQPYVKAFVNTKIPVPVADMPTSALKRPAYRPTRPVDDQSEESESYDKTEMQEWAAELAASVGSLIVISQGQSDIVKLGDMIKNPDAYGHVGQRGFVEAPKPTE